jgi:hypothetical protein
MSIIYTAIMYRCIDVNYLYRYHVLMYWCSIFENDINNLLKNIFLETILYQLFLPKVFHLIVSKD